MLHSHVPSHYSCWDAGTWSSLSQSNGSAPDFELEALIQSSMNYILYSRKGFILPPTPFTNLFLSLIQAGHALLTSFLLSTAVWHTSGWGRYRWSFVLRFLKTFCLLDIGITLSVFSHFYLECICTSSLQQPSRNQEGTTLKIKANKLRVVKQTERNQYSWQIFKS